MTHVVENPLLPITAKTKIFLGSEPIDFRLSINGLSELVRKNNGTYLHDGSIYVFYNKHKDKIKCLFWDRNGFVLYYKRLDRTKFKLKEMTKEIELLTHEDLALLISGYEPIVEKPRVKATKTLFHRIANGD